MTAFFKAAFAFLGSELGIYAMIAAAGLFLVGTQWNWQSLVTVPRLESALEAEKNGRASDARRYDEQVRAAKAAELAATQRERATETLWRGKLDAEVEAGQARLAAAQAGRDAVVRERDGLRRANSDLAAQARRTPAGAPAPAECAPAIAAVDLQSDMLERLGGWAADLAAFADAAHSAGLVCQRGWPVNPAASGATP